MENFVVSALKYRPATFRSVVGQHALTGTLKNAILSRKLAHAYLFCGPRGVGKTTCARIFAKSINCFNPTAEGEACNQCESCVSFNEQRSFNIYELDAASNNSVNDIKALVDQVRIPPQLGSYKVYIIDEVHMLSTAAFNAFLKTLEEPPAYAIFILATTEKHKVLPTILSRCQIYDFNRMTVNDTVAHLAYVAGQENVRAEEAALNVIAQKADGAMRDALSIFDQVVSFTGGNVTYQAVIENLNVLDYDYYFRLINHFLKGEVPNTLLIFDEIINKGFDGQHFITGLASFFRDILVSRDESTLHLLEVADAVKLKYRDTARTCSIPFLYRALEISNDCDLNYRLSKNKRLLVELALIRLCQINNPAIPGNVQQPGSNAGSSALPANAQQPIQPIAQTARPAQSQASAPSVQSSQTATTAVPSQSAPPQAPPTNADRPQARPATATQGIPLMMPWEKKEVKIEEKKAAAVVSNERTAVTLEGIMAAWKAYAKTIPQQVLMVSAMDSSDLQLVSSEQIQVTVLNPSQEQQINDHGSDLLQYLRKTLHNSYLGLKVVVTADRQQTRAFSNPEKFSEMLKELPILDQMRRDFSLQIN